MSHFGFRATLVGLFIPLSPSCMGGFLLGYNPSTLPQLPPEQRVVPLPCPPHFGQQMIVLSCDVISFSSFCHPSIHT